MIVWGGRQLEEKAGNLSDFPLEGADAPMLSEETAFSSFGSGGFLNKIGFDQVVWILVSLLLCVGLLGFLWFFFFGGHLTGYSSVMAFRLEVPLDQL